MKTLKFKILYALLLLVNPSFAAAQVKSRTIKGIAGDLTTFLSKSVMPMLFAIALALFVWGIVDFIRHAENSNERKLGKQRMLWGIIGLFAMVTYIGLTSVVTQTGFGKDASLPLLYTNEN